MKGATNKQHCNKSVSKRNRGGLILVILFVLLLPLVASAQPKSGGLKIPPKKVTPAKSDTYREQTITQRISKIYVELKREIKAHSFSDTKMNALYCTHDWNSLYNKANKKRKSEGGPSFNPWIDVADSNPTVKSIEVLDSKNVGGVLHATVSLRLYYGGDGGATIILVKTLKLKEESGELKIDDFMVAGRSCKEEIKQYLAGNYQRECVTF